MNDIDSDNVCVDLSIKGSSAIGFKYQDFITDVESPSLTSS